jgi:hypothetical protein
LNARGFTVVAAVHDLCLHGVEVQLIFVSQPARGAAVSGI